MEAEYVAATHAVKEAIWLCKLVLTDTLTKPLPKWKTALHNLSLGLHHICGGVVELVPPETEEGCKAAETMPPYAPGHMTTSYQAMFTHSGHVTHWYGHA